MKLNINKNKLRRHGLKKKKKKGIENQFNLPFARGQNLLMNTKFNCLITLAEDVHS